MGSAVRTRSTANTQPRKRELWRAAKHGFPASYPLVQLPNVPIVVAAVAAVVAMLTDGAVHDAAQVVARAFLAIWGYLELTAGVNAFRRVLGGAGLIGALWLLLS